ncbi:hypothetical protein SB659_07890 [Arthrobacter sp. SIMBA_036]|uniref:hypothetical protein n=1 Tax=Arthrobacter sp. SIMBA_036 TaxID=3085778 RepID=UPI00397D6AFF
MSNAAATTRPSVVGHSVVGNTARQLPLPGGKPDVDRKARTPLSLVRSVPVRRRTPFVVLCFAAMAAALLTVLVLNISVSTAQYQLVQLKAQAATLDKENQDLTQQKQSFEAPQNLAAKAAELGMVASTVKGQIDVNTMTVTGKAVPAVKGDAPGAVIAPPALSGQAPSAAAKDATAAASTATTSKSSAPATPAPATSQAATPSPAPTASVPAAAPPVDLNGGSVPAPLQKVPGQ